MAKPLLPTTYMDPKPERKPVPAGRKSNAGKYHLGGYFETDDPLVVQFRLLAAMTHRRQQDLLAEAIGLLIDKHRAADAFGGK